MAGRYRLVTVCAGSGALTANFTIGSHTISKQLESCSADGTLDDVIIEVPLTTVGMTVELIPGRDSKAAVGYLVQLL